MVNAGWFGSMRSEILLQMKFIIFQGCPTKQAAFLPGQTAPYHPYSATLACSRMLFCIKY